MSDDYRFLGVLVARILKKHPDLLPPAIAAIKDRIPKGQLVEVLSLCSALGLSTIAAPKPPMSDERRAQLSENLRKARAAKTAKRTT